jgi:hypothetical protein
LKVKKDRDILKAVESVKTRMSQSGLDYDNHNDFMTFMRLVRSGDVVVDVE